ncbi:MAG: tetratricopeptide repeat protein [Bacteroidia bacterium]|nr:tetratricopeptide repeat protein [Bacteroidia bacterium]
METPRLTQLLNFLAEDPTDAFNLYAVANEYYAQQAYEAACTWFEQLRTLHPGYIGLYYHLASVYELLGNIPEALNVCEAGQGVAQAQRNAHAAGELQRLRQRILDEAGL